MTPRPALHRKPDLLLATITLLALLLPPTMALQMRAAQVEPDAAAMAVEPAPVLVQVVLREDSRVDSGGGASPVAGHLGSGIQRHL